MSAKEQDIRDRLKQLAETFGPAPTLLGKVKSVASNTCVVTDSDVDYTVRLNVVIGAQEGQTLFPQVGSYALAVRIENTQYWQLVACSALDKWRVSVGTRVIEQDLSGMEISNGTANLKDVLTGIIEACLVINSSPGVPPDLVKLGEALAKTNLILK